MKYEEYCDLSWEEQNKEDEKIAEILGIDVDEYIDKYREGIFVGFSKEQIDYLTKHIKTKITID